MLGVCWIRFYLLYSRFNVHLYLEVFLGVFCTHRMPQIRPSPYLKGDVSHMLRINLSRPAKGPNIDSNAVMINNSITKSRNWCRT